MQEEPDLYYRNEFWHFEIKKAVSLSSFIALASFDSKFDQESFAYFVTSIRKPIPYSQTISKSNYIVILNRTKNEAL